MSDFELAKVGLGILAVILLGGGFLYQAIYGPDVYFVEKCSYSTRIIKVVPKEAHLETEYCYETTIEDGEDSYSKERWNCGIQRLQCQH